jgi:hypothetical protein
MPRDLNFGPQWLRRRGKELSAEGERVARFCEWLFDGIYHQEHAVLAADWSSFYVALNLTTDLSSYDGSLLMRLVVGAHDFCIRVEIVPCNFRYLKVYFHPREDRVGSFARRHPTIEDAIAKMVRPELPTFCEACGYYPCQCGLSSAKPVRVGRERRALTDAQRAAV